MLWLCYYEIFTLFHINVGKIHNDERKSINNYFIVFTHLLDSRETNNTEWQLFSRRQFTLNLEINGHTKITEAETIANASATTHDTYLNWNLWTNEQSRLALAFLCLWVCASLCRYSVLSVCLYTKMAFIHPKNDKSTWFSRNWKFVSCHLTLHHSVQCAFGVWYGVCVIRSVDTIYYCRLRTVLFYMGLLFGLCIIMDVKWFWFAIHELQLEV